MKPKNKTNYLQMVSNYQSLVFFGLGISVFLLGLIVIWPKIQEINQARLTLNQNTQYLNKLKAKLADLESLNEYELTDRNNLSLRAIPEIKNPLGTLISLRSLATEMNISVEEISVAVGGVSSESGQKKSTDLAQINFKVKLTGAKTDIFGFFKKTEESLPIISADSVKIALSGDFASAELKLSSYYLSYPETIGKIDTPVSKLSNDEEKLLDKIKGFAFVPPTTFTPAQGRNDPFGF